MVRAAVDQLGPAGEVQDLERDQGRLRHRLPDALPPRQERDQPVKREDHRRRPVGLADRGDGPGPGAGQRRLQSGQSGDGRQGLPPAGVRVGFHQHVPRPRGVRQDQLRQGQHGHHLQAADDIGGRDEARQERSQGGGAGDGLQRQDRSQVRAGDLPGIHQRPVPRRPPAQRPGHEHVLADRHPKRRVQVQTPRVQVAEHQVDRLLPELPREVAESPASRQLRRALDQEFGLLIEGRVGPAVSGRTFTDVSPVTEGPIAEVPDAGEADVARAVAAAAAAAPAWRRVAPRERGRRVRAIAAVLLEHADERPCSTLSTSATRSATCAGGSRWPPTRSRCSPTGRWPRGARRSPPRPSTCTSPPAVRTAWWRGSSPSTIRSCSPPPRSPLHWWPATPSCSSPQTWRRCPPCASGRC